MNGRLILPNGVIFEGEISVEEVASLIRRDSYKPVIKQTEKIIEEKKDNYTKTSNAGRPPGQKKNLSRSKKVKQCENCKLWYNQKHIKEIDGKLLCFRCRPDEVEVTVTKEEDPPLGDPKGWAVCANPKCRKTARKSMMTDVNGKLYCAACSKNATESQK